MAAGRTRWLTSGQRTAAGPPPLDKGVGHRGYEFRPAGRRDLPDRIHRATGSMMVELTPEVDAFFGSIKALSDDWDGTELIHRP